MRPRIRTMPEPWPDCLATEKSVHVAASAREFDYSNRSPALQRMTQLAWEVLMLEPDRPRRGLWDATGDSPVWVEWHRVRSIDPCAYKSRGYRLPEPIRRAVIARDGYICRLCGGSVEPGDVHIDHVRPRVLGGSDEVKNLQVAHSFCNISKGARVAGLLPTKALR